VFTDRRLRQVTTDPRRLVTLVVRWGLPLIILLFYLTASRRMGFTADGTYATLDIVRTISQSGVYSGPADLPGSVSASPLWALFVAAGSHLGLEPLNVAKVFSLFFSCMLLVLTYLVAFEVTDDRLLAFCATFTVAIQSWLVFLAPGGTALPLELMLVMAALFFLLRNDYSLAAICAGLASLVGWEGILLIACILADAGMNIVIRGQVLRIANRVLLVFAATVLPWVIYAWRHGLPVLTATIPSGDGALVGPISVLGVVLPIVVAIGGVGFAAMRSEGWIPLRVYAASIAWTFAAIDAGWIAGWEHGLAGMPLLLIGAIAGVQRGLRALRKEGAAYTAAFALAAVLLLVNQLSFYADVKPVMVRAEESTARIEALAAWIRAEVPGDASIESSRPGQVGFLTERTVTRYVPGGRPSGDILVCEDQEVAGFTEVSLPPEVPPVILGGGGWKIFTRR
jgi:hypothetical protein